VIVAQSTLMPQRKNTALMRGPFTIDAIANQVRVLRRPFYKSDPGVRDLVALIEAAKQSASGSSRSSSSTRG
jgi:hypothetical protein